MGVFNGAAMLDKVLECDTTTEDQIWKLWSCYVLSGIEMWSVNARTTLKVVQLYRTTLK